MYNVTLRQVNLNTFPMEKKQRLSFVFLWYILMTRTFSWQFYVVGNNKM